MESKELKNPLCEELEDEKLDMVAGGCNVNSSDLTKETEYAEIREIVECAVGAIVEP